MRKKDCERVIREFAVGYSEEKIVETSTVVTFTAGNFPVAVYTATGFYTKPVCNYWVRRVSARYRITRRLQWPLPAVACPAAR